MGKKPQLPSKRVPKTQAAAWAHDGFQNNLQDETTWYWEVQD